MNDNENVTHYIIKVDKHLIQYLVDYFTEKITVEEITQACKEDETGMLLLLVEFQFKHSRQVLTDKARDISRVRLEKAEGYMSESEANDLIDLYQKDMGVYLTTIQLLINLQVELVSATLDPQDEFDMGEHWTLAEYEEGSNIPPLILSADENN